MDNSVPIRTAPRVLGRTKEGWLNLKKEMDVKLRKLERRRDEVMISGDGERAKELQLEINITKGTLLASMQVLSNPPFMN